MFRLNLLKAVVTDIPMDAYYGDETSNLNIRKILLEFFRKNIVNCVKRITFNYFVRDMSIASIELVAGLSMFWFGIVFGAYNWIRTFTTNVETPSGTIMISFIAIILGFQLLLSFLSFDMSSIPKRPLQKYSYRFDLTEDSHK